MAEDRTTGNRTDNPLLRTIGILAIVSLVALAEPAAGAEAETASGEELFLDQRCNVCHGVEAAGIEAKAKKPAPDLTGYHTDDLAALARFLRKEEPRDGEDHTKGFKGTDEELAAIVAWLTSLAPEEGP